MSRKFIHRIGCAAIGCGNDIRWEDESVLMTGSALRLLELNGWREDHDRWLCGNHEVK